MGTSDLTPGMGAAAETDMRIPGARGGRVVDWIRHHPIGAFLIWFATIGQLFAFAPLIAVAAGVDVIPQLFILGSTLVGMFLPAVVITRVVDGPDGLGDFMRRVASISASPAWYAFALLLLPLSALALAIVFFGPPRVELSVVVSAFVFGFLLQGAIVFITNNLWEEAAVMGFLQSRLQAQHGAMRAVLLTSLFFTFQHISLILASDSVALVLPFFLITALGFRAVMAWTYNRTASLFIVGLVHATSNAATGGSGFGGPGFLGRLYEGEQFALVLHIVAAAIVGLVLVVTTHGRLGLRVRMETPTA